MDLIIKVDRVASIQFPLIIELDFTPHNIMEILKSFPNIKGIGFKLGSNELRNDLHCIEFEKLKSILRVLNC